MLAAMARPLHIRARRAVRALTIVATTAAFLLLPVSMVLGSLRLPGLPPPEGFEWLPRPIHVGNYETVRRLVPDLGLALRNSLVVVAGAVPVTVVVGSLAGFAIARAEPRRQRALVLVTVLALLVPASALWVPRFVMFRTMGVLDTLWPVMAPALMATTPFYVLLFAYAHHRVPRELYESAELEGLSPISTWWRVALPLARPAVFAVAILAFAFHWSNLVDPLLYVSSPERATLALSLSRLQELEPTNQSLTLAACVLASAPAVLAFLAAQRAFLGRTVSA